MAVCFFHFTTGQQHFLDVSLLRSAGTYGWVGVQAFFVISGFIVPYSMARANYALARWPRFMAKRLIRLEPPYLVSIAVVMLLALLSSVTPGLKARRSIGSFPRSPPILAIFNGWIDRPWLNPVYWSLAIEFQFYLLVGACVTSPLRRFAGDPDWPRCNCRGVALAHSWGRPMVHHPLFADLCGRSSDFPFGARPDPTVGPYWSALAVLAAHLGVASGPTVMLATILPCRDHRHCPIAACGPAGVARRSVLLDLPAPCSDRGAHHELGDPPARDIGDRDRRSYRRLRHIHPGRVRPLRVGGEACSRSRGVHPIQQGSGTASAIAKSSSNASCPLRFSAAAGGYRQEARTGFEAKVSVLLRTDLAGRSRASPTFDPSATGGRSRHGP